MNNTFEWSPDELYHHGILGQKWGRRRWQNPDGTLTEAGKRRYGTAENFNRIHDRKKVKYMTDDELRRHTARLEAEAKYKALNRNPVAENIAKAISSIAEARSKKRDYEIQKLKATADYTRATSEIAKAKAEKKKATASVVSNLFGEGRGKYFDAKDKRSKNTIRGALAHVGRRAVTRMGTKIFGADKDEAAWAERRKNEKIAKKEERGRKKAQRILESWSVDPKQQAGYDAARRNKPKGRPTSTGAIPVYGNVY